MTNHITTINDVVDVLTARMEAATDPAEREALRRAMIEIEKYLAREARVIEHIEQTIQTIAEKGAA